MPDPVRRDSAPMMKREWPAAVETPLPGIEFSNPRQNDKVCCRDCCRALKSSHQGNRPRIAHDFRCSGSPTRFIQNPAI